MVPTIAIAIAIAAAVVAVVIIIMDCGMAISNFHVKLISERNTPIT